MRISTIILQTVCVGIGILVVSVGVTGRALLFSGIVFGCLFFFFAALLGADHTSNPDSASRRKFKIAALLSACPVLALGVLGMYKSAQSGLWLEALSTFGKLLIFTFLVIGVAFASHPRMRRLLESMGLSVEKSKS